MYFAAGLFVSHILCCYILPFVLCDVLPPECLTFGWCDSSYVMQRLVFHTTFRCLSVSLLWWFMFRFFQTVTLLPLLLVSSYRQRLLFFVSKSCRRYRCQSFGRFRFETIASMSFFVSFCLPPSESCHYVLFVTYLSAVSAARVSQNIVFRKTISLPTGEY